MHRKELNERSPVRVLEASIHGGLGRGNIGVVMARKGVGKTAFLVGVAMDELMQGRKVLHVSMDDESDKVRSYYDEMFQDLAHERKLEDVWKVRLEMERNRRIHCYMGGSFSIDRLGEAIRFLGEHGDFRPSAIVLDGYDFENARSEDLVKLREMAKFCDAELWMSAVTHREATASDKGVPEPVARVEKDVDVILQMAHDTKAVHVSLLKDHDNPEVSSLKLALDPTTMLLVKESWAAD